jgi:SAM-dependent methyltransferase
METHWPIKLFKKSVLKQTKYQKINRTLGPTEGKNILEIGSDNGVFSYLFRQRGGRWKSADIDERSVKAIRSLVHDNVYRISDGHPLPFADDEFDCVIIVDLIEHLENDQAFIEEIFRVLKPGGPLIINAPCDKSKSLLMRLRQKIGITEAEHGHVRPGYSYETLRALLDQNFILRHYETHTKFFSKFTDTFMVLMISLLKRGKREKTSGRGVLVTDTDLKSYKTLFRIYSLIYPFVWTISKLDKLLFFTSGYMFIATAESVKS